jgi:hypothetical protein
MHWTDPPAYLISPSALERWWGLGMKAGVPGPARKGAPRCGKKGHARQFGRTDSSDGLHWRALLRRDSPLVVLACGIFSSAETNAFRRDALHAPDPAGRFARQQPSVDASTGSLLGESALALPGKPGEDFVEPQIVDSFGERG